MAKYIPELVNSLFYGNLSGEGAGVYGFGFDPPYAGDFVEVLFHGINLTLSDNSAVVAGGGYATDGASIPGLQVFTNSIFWHNLIDEDPGSAAAAIEALQQWNHALDAYREEKRAK